LSKPFNPDILLSKVRVFISLYEQRLQLEDWSKSLEKLVAQRTKELASAYESTLEGWALAMELREQETAGHCFRVVELTLNFARRLKIPQEDLVHIHRGALLHDIGKMGVPDSILLKPGPLTEEEWVVMRKHPAYAYELLSQIDFLLPALDIPYYHHEKWDGSGYPTGLRGEDIPLAARIFAIVDVWDALLSDRPYRDALPQQQVIEYIKGESGRHFDPGLVTVFFEMMESAQIPAVSPEAG
jgi:putative nucleotidyltransferase with HDIG domain